MATPSKKRALMEPEAGETKAHEMGESPEVEQREGAEPEEQPAKAKTNRKRSAKNVKNTKAPLDSDCGCGGKKGASCDGNCGGYAKKMDRNDALTPQEYLKACELGIQGRSRAYIRARLDAVMVVRGKSAPCGGSHIAAGKHCHKGAGAANPNKETSVKYQMSKGLVNGAVKGAVSGALGGLLSKKISLKNVGAMAASGATLGGAFGASQGLGTALGIRAGNAVARQIARKPARRDSIYAAGFSPELDQLAI